MDKETYDNALGESKVLDENNFSSASTITLASFSVAQSATWRP
jgi:hypothetical protein